MGRKITQAEIDGLREYNKTHKFVSVEEYQDLLDWMPDNPNELIDLIKDNMSNFLCSNIEVLDGWDAIFRRPSMYLGKISLYGLECYVNGMMHANFKWLKRYEVMGVDIDAFEMWVRKKYSSSLKSFELALGEAKQDDERAFEVWANWLNEFRNIQ